MPIENAYQPLLPALTAITSVAAGLPIGRAFHILIALAYCAGPVTLFWLVWEWSESFAASFSAGLLFSLISPAAMLFPAVRAVSGSALAPERLFNIVYYGEDPHALALTLLPVALVFLRRLIVRRDRWSFIGAVLSCAAVVTTNAFGAASIALGALCTVVASGAGVGVVAAAGVVSWCLVSPWIPPSLLGTIRGIALSTRGQYREGLRSELAVVLLVALFAAIWFASRRFAAPFERFVSLFALCMCAFPVAYYAFDVTLVPQAHRYQLELELGVCLVLGVVVARLFRGPLPLRLLAIGALAVLVAVQAPAYRRFARSLIRPVEIEKTAEYRLAKWIDANLPGDRVMVSGDAAWLFNVFSDNPQMSAGHDASTPNFMQQVAVYQLYTGMNAGQNDAEISYFWLKAFGNQAVTMPGAQTSEIYKPYVNPAKFDGVLPVLWRDHGDTIYEVPQRSRSLIHVIPADVVVKKQPVHGLDLDPARAYVAALDNPDLPAIEPRWEGFSKAAFRAPLEANQVISIQMNYAKGWRARVRGQSRALTKDGLGMMIVDPGCTGDCEVELEFGPTAETWFCRVLSAGAGMVLLALASAIVDNRKTRALSSMVRAADS